MPELPEVESARATVEAGALGRRIASVDDTDTWECRPHAPGDIEHALVGRVLTGAFRRGKSMWCETSDVGRDDGSGPVLGLHLGMSGRILVTDGDGRSTEGGDWLGGRYGRIADQPDRKPEWDRFTIRFADGGELRLFDKRRLGRVRLDPDLSALGPDAQRVDLDEFAGRVGRGTAPVKARLLDQSVVAGVGNLLADETLWQARLSPRRPVDESVPAVMLAWTWLGSALANVAFFGRPEVAMYGFVGMGVLVGPYLFLFAARRRGAVTTGPADPRRSQSRA